MRGASRTATRESASDVEFHNDADLPTHAALGFERTCRLQFFHCASTTGP